MKPFIRARQAALAQMQKLQLNRMGDLAVGPGTLYDVPRMLRDQDVRCVMVVTTQGFVERGVIPSFERALLMAGVTAAVFTGAKPDPDIECVREAAAFYQSRGCEAIVAIGGGSAIDCAKAAGALVTNPGKDVRDLFGVMKVRRPIPYLVAVPTTAGSGSEATATAEISDPDRQRKRTMSDSDLMPDVAVLDPNLLLELPRAMTAYAGMDALARAVEAYINRFGSHAARKHAEDAVALVFKHLKASYDDGEKAAYRENMLLASYYAGIASTNAVTGYVHALAHGVGGRYHVQHGLASAVLLPAVLEEHGQAAEPRLACLAEAIGLGGATDHELAVKFIAAIRELSASMGVPDAIPEIREGDIPELAAKAAAEGNPAYPAPEIWDAGRFEKVLHRAAGVASAAGAPGGDLAVPAPDTRPRKRTRRVAKAAGAAAAVIATAIGAIALVVRRR